MLYLTQGVLLVYLCGSPWWSYSFPNRCFEAQLFLQVFGASFPLLAVFPQEGFPPPPLEEQKEHHLRRCL